MLIFISLEIQLYSNVAHGKSDHLPFNGEVKEITYSENPGYHCDRFHHWQLKYDTDQLG